MMRPTPDQERWLLLTARFKLQQVDAAHTGGWRSVGVLIRIALFVLGLAAAAMLVAIAELLHIRPATLLVGVALMLAAEVIIATRKLSHCGIEEAWSLAGLMMLSFWIVEGWFRFDTLAVTTALTTSFAFAAWRLRNALFGVCAALVASMTIYFALAQMTGANDQRHHIAALFCYAVAWAALALGGFKFRRPSVDHRLDWLVISMPVAGYLWSIQATLFAMSFAAGGLDTDVMAMPILFGISAVWTGLQRRRHAPLLAGMLCVACVGFELRGVSGWSLTQRLLVWGVAILLVALCLERWLRIPRRGVTAQKLNDRTELLDELQWAGAAAITPKASPAESSFEGEGGQFGGGGASGKF